MFVAGNRRWYAGTEQRASGSFLVLCLPRRPETQTEFACKAPKWHGVPCDGLLTAWAGELATCPKCGREWYAPPWSAPFDLLRCFVRHVRLEQCGHWMLGEMTVHGERIALSGTYGHDGLPVDVDRSTWEHGVPLPREIIDVYRTGGGHNSAGAEGPLVYEWARRNLKQLRAASRAVRATTT